MVSSHLKESLAGNPGGTPMGVVMETMVIMTAHIMVSMTDNPRSTVKVITADIGVNRG